MQEATVKFGDGTTLPFTPCKKGYRPYHNGKRMYACPLHDKQRQQRVTKDAGCFRNGEVVLDMFWTDTSTEGSVISASNDISNNNNNNNSNNEKKNRKPKVETPLAKRKKV